jgi:hypothetical protein
MVTSTLFKTPIFSVTIKCISGYPKSYQRKAINSLLRFTAC